jgi:aspartate 1-decarboxylase
MRMMLKSKIHRALVTDAHLNYEGSITLDPALMEAADILPYELVHVLDTNNGSRFETYAIAGERDSGVVCANGAAARLVQPGDQVIILSFRILDDQQAVEYRPKIVHLDADNRLRSDE